MVALAAFAASKARIAYALVRKLVRCSFVTRAELRARAIQPTRVPAAHESGDRVSARVFLATCEATPAG